MRVDEGRHEAGTGQVDLIARLLRVDVGAHIGIGADGHDASVAQQYGLGAGILMLHGEHGAAVEKRLHGGPFLRLGRY